MTRESTVRAYGGQAVLDGVMMKGARAWAVAVRTPEGGIALAVHRAPAWPARWRRVPVVRGVATLAESLLLGTRALAWSAEQGLPEEHRSGSRALEAVLGVLGLALVLAVFVAGPALVAGALPGLDGGLAFSLAEGAVRAALLVAYVAALGVAPDLRRVYEYHGAEHKAVSALEAGAELTPASLAAFSTRHPRCGTTFLLVVVVVGVLAHALVGRPPLPALVAGRLALVPLVAGVSYELIRAAAARLDRRWASTLMAPGLALQRLTTREPSPAQLEVALTALTAVLAEDGSGAVGSPVEGGGADGPGARIRAGTTAPAR